ncbi:site-specific DNA-methyltransferase [Corynebacterium glutamicum]|nr:site-specific DNA-methyltransferase [Corynebacterium glutamicum]QDQ23288.1 site-specific DNA-methyltransferase [Corynebacterium glutamicum]
MEKLSMTSRNLTDVNIGKLAELFPSVVTETIDADGDPQRSIDFDLLRQELSDHVVEGPQERYQLNWPGKRAAAFAANAPIAKTLRPVREDSVNFDTTKNIFIEGDNLDALKLLQESYLGKVKMIYIDPPYNTGNDFVYNDDFAESKDEYLLRSGQADESGARLNANLESNGRFHSDWLSMILPRLKLARNLLTDDGAVFISIDDAEMGNLQRVASEVFGESNFIGTMVWAAGRKNDSKYISSSHEYILCYARNLDVLKSMGITWKVRKKGLSEIYAEANRLVREHQGDYELASRALKEWYKTLPDSDDAKRNKHYSRIDSRGVYFAGDISWPGGGGPKYEVLHPVTGRPVKIPSRGWLFQEPVMLKHIQAGKVAFGPTEESVPTFKRYLRETEFEVPYSVFYQDGRAASKRLRSLMDGPVFSFPKDESVIQTLVNMVTKDDDLVLDFFAGSGTTAQAVMAQNVADGGRRRFILVQLDEKPDSKSEAARQQYASIADIARERIQRAARLVSDGIGLAADELDSGFRSLVIDTTNMKDVFRVPDETDQLALEQLESSVKQDRSNEDLLFQVLLDWGLELTMPIETKQLENNEVLVVEDGALIACFDEHLSMQAVRRIADQQPLRAVFRDSGFASDDARINAEQIFAEVSPATDVKAI